MGGTQPCNDWHPVLLHGLQISAVPTPQAYDYLSAAALVLFSLLVAIARTGGLKRLRQWAVLAAPAAAAYG